jgi:TP901 family phage tail tape measure protein
MNNLRLQVILSAVDKLTAPFRSSINASKGLSAAISATRDQIKGLESTQRSIGQLGELESRAQATTAKIGGMTGKLEQWRHERALASEASKVQRAEIKTLTQTMGGLETVMKHNSNPEVIAQYAMMSERLGLLNRQLEWNKSKQQAAAKHIREGNTALLSMNKTAETTRTNISNLTQELSAAGVDVSQLADEEKRLKTRLESTNSALEAQRKKMALITEQQRRMSAAKAAYDKTRAIQGTLASTGAGLMATGAATGALAIKPVIDYAQAEDAATGLKVSMMGAGGVVHKEFAAISDLATKLGNQLPGTTADFQNMMSTLIQQGMSAKAILGGLGEATAYLGVQMKMPYDQAAQFAAKLQDATGTAEKDMMGLMDTIQRSYYLGVDSGNMLGAFTNLSPALSILRKKGLEASQVLAPLIVMADQAGMAGDAAGNAYRKIFQMSMDAGKVADTNTGALKGTGIALQFSDGKGEFAGLDNLFSQLAKMRKLTTEQRLETLKGIYGDDAETLQALNLMIDKGQDGYNATIKKMKAQADLQSRVNTQLGTLKNLWDAATGTFTNALVVFGEAVAPDVKALVTWIGKLSERLGAWSKANPVLSNWLMKTVAAIAAVTAGAGALALAIAAILGPFAMMRFSAVTLGLKLPMLGSGLKLLMMPLNMLTSGVIRLGIAIMTTPVGWIAAAIVALVAVIAVAATLIYKHWAPIKAFFQGVFEGLSAALGPVKALFEPLGPLCDGICRAVKWAFSLFGDLLEPVKYTSAELQNAAAMGKQFGEYMAAGIDFALAPLNTMIDGIQWVLDNIGKLPGMGEGAVNHAKVIGNNPALASGYLTGNYGPAATAGGFNYVTGGYTPAEAKPYQPVRMSSQTTVVDNTLHAPITVHAAPGMDEAKVGQMVEAKLQAAQQRQAARSRARLGDRD